MNVKSNIKHVNYIMKKKTAKKYKMNAKQLEYIKIIILMLLQYVLL